MERLKENLNQKLCDSPRVFISPAPPLCDLVTVPVLSGRAPSISVCRSTELGAANHSDCLHPSLVFAQTLLFRFCQDTLITLYVLFQSDRHGGSLLFLIYLHSPCVNTLNSPPQKIRKRMCYMYTGPYRFRLLWVS